MRTVYFDHAATTPVDEDVLNSFLPFYKDQFGNPNSAHSIGQRVHVAVEEAREKVASLLGAEPSEIIFTSGGTESDNAAIKGVVEATGKSEIITSRIEHHAVLHPIECGKRNGLRPVYLDVGEDGTISPQQVASAITEDTALVTLMHVNNEIGSINPVKEIAEVCRKHNVPFHSDTVQSMGKIPVKMDELGIDLASVSGHKIYGPKGIGVLYVRGGTPWVPWMQGGSQERRRRGGTLNAPGIVALAKALELAVDRMENDTATCFTLRTALENGLRNRFGDRISFNSNSKKGVPHILNISVRDEAGNPLDGEMLLLNLDMEGICVSNGSACTSGAIEPSHVLVNLGLDDEMAKSSIRISFGKTNTKEDIDYFLGKFETVLDRMKAKV